VRGTEVPDPSRAANGTSCVVSGAPQTIGNSPFQGISFQKKPSQRYRSTFNVFNLIEASNRKLANEEPELFKNLLTCIDGRFAEGRD
jgi:hypothetical protein